MVVLRNIERKKDTIEADFYPEDSKEAGHVVVDIESKKIISKVDVKGYEFFSYAHHAKNGLIDLIEKEELPEKYIVMWY